MIGKTIDQLKIGDSDEFTKTISESDIYLFAGITGDLNPAHINEEYAKNTFFKGRIAHGLFIGGFVSTVIGTKLPGPGSIYSEQQLKFLAPVRIGDTITARVEVKEINIEKNKITLETSCFNQNKIIVVDGKAIIHPPKEKIKKNRNTIIPIKQF
ncbi:MULTISPECIES: MaoC family dehydratase [Desulfobacula]|uniref:MaoC domain protein dehydratase n=2 Tax=Desulfobacula TaxID=28222 RepID=K0NK11_DESTT|nr:MULTISPECIES: MaoC family dehydratase [Desulfobacula]CCK81851.1 MaoC domain protein dehydratase [Desulfobacula toluolica Tol2]SDT86572.1 3-hydroxybutyryl-CoA dehydratase [Desulfobacula phenolica]